MFPTSSISIWLNWNNQSWNEIVTILYDRNRETVPSESKEIQLTGRSLFVVLLLVQFKQCSKGDVTSAGLVYKTTNRHVNKMHLICCWSTITRLSDSFTACDCFNFKYKDMSLGCNYRDNFLWSSQISFFFLFLLSNFFIINWYF